MTGHPPRSRFKVWLASTTAALACWALLPGSAPDRAAFTFVVRSFANPPLVVAGNGRHGSPWTLRTLAGGGRDASRAAPVVISLGDDPEGVFQSAPPSPVDLAVVFSNLQRLGVKHAAASAVLAWDAPDVIGLAALDKVLGRFDSMLMTAPLTRGAAPEPMPAAFRRASLPLQAIRGDTTAIPAVNRIPIPNVIFGGENTRAGFQRLESEPATDFHPLLARWGDRVVFSFPLLATMQRLELPLEGMEIRPGNVLKLGPQGPTVPLDRFGRLAVRVKPVRPLASIPAEAVIGSDRHLLPQSAPAPVILRDDLSGAEPATRAFSAALPAVVATLASDAGLLPGKAFRRPPATMEIASLLTLTAVLAWVGGLGGFARATGFLTIGGACVSAQFIAAGLAAMWLPGPAALAALATGWGVLWGITPRSVPPHHTAPSGMVESAPPPLSPPDPEENPASQPAPKPPRKRGKKRRR